jgi:hypothetical protein
LSCLSVLDLQFPFVEICQLSEGGFGKIDVLCVLLAASASVDYAGEHALLWRIADCTHT